MPRRPEIAILISAKLPDKPEVDQLAAQLGVDHDAVLGKLVRFWLWAKAYSEDGNGIGVTSALLDRLTNCPGFTDSLLKVGWLISRNGRLCVPGFDRYIGQTAISRALTKDRVRRSREANTTSKDGDECNANGVTSKNASSLSLEDTSKDSSSGRKKSLKEYPSSFNQFWSAYPIKIGKDAALRAWTRAGKRIRDSTGKSSAEAAEHMRKAAEAFAASDKGKGEFCPHASTWLNRGSYDDDPASWKDRKSAKPESQRYTVSLEENDL